ncbi:YlaN family protein [Paenibacillus apiarius]|uniref:YlaN family protein n=1 Tax=Paenibacillus apiarius TaxID=46240 RepID=A0ABT4DPM1_9BACL|nr:YlaN family protein [Paenibacillus apiarius]MBN3526047.1 YlaN family protein [Paenibacillus apiarius]MCY9513672.1 YlaN family protein [Paenibacillus apiarius]MCY9518223.1 YlaN family protein [Paenibacillus apiarius]MCY9551376.1 YlaN family protein [Paenibacillus apiarius]MCY9558530.1 YlaN family protein [Paenibacillus apiarius]
MSSSNVVQQINDKALALLEDEAHQIEKLIQVQMENLATRYCPLYEEVLDTQMYGFSRQVDFAVRAGLVQENVGRQLVSKLERNLAILYEALNKAE